MHLTRRLALLVAVLTIALSGSIQARSILEKTLYYVSDGAVRSAKYWTMHLGNHDVKLTRRYPGEDERPIDATVNLSMVSSGYVEGNGYGERGVVQARAQVALLADDEVTGVAVDSVDYVAGGGEVLRLLNGRTGRMGVSVEGFPVEPRRLQLWIYQMGHEYGEDILRKTDDIDISAFSFTKEGIARAQKARP